MHRQLEIERRIALVQHQLNNPLAALLAELQLLQSEPTLSDEHRPAVERSLALVRRLIGVVRELDQRIVREVAG
ncbi:MAG TPA: histidine kinase dimerization/phospho-acceptor domain-containing protein [Gemmatimonadaceae bacterium]|nr:histidine kinase dimerization/phospho-acceptor domain-containing protein [Gemmatimonadaceae bacterium]